MSIVASLTALLKLDTQGFSSGVNSAIKSASKLNRRMTFVSRDIQTAGASITALSAPLIYFGASSVLAAARAEEHANKIRVVFSEMEQEAGASIRSFAKDFDLAESTATSLISTTGDLLTGFGLSQREALKLSSQVNRLAADLTSFNPDIDNVADASERLTKGLLGQTRAMIGLKIAIRQDTKEFQDLVAKIQLQKNLSVQAAKALAIFQISVEQSKNAVGDYARTSTSFINVLRRIGQQVIELKQEFGTFLIQGLDLEAVLLKINNGIKAVTGFIKGLTPEMKSLIAKVLLGITVFGPLLLIFGTIGIAITGVVSGVLALASAFAAIFTPVGLVIAGLVSLGAIFVKVFDIDLKKNALKVLGFLVNLKTNFKILSTFLKTLFSNIWTNLPMVVSKVWENVLTNIRVAFQKITVVLITSFLWIVNNWQIMLDKMIIKLVVFIVKAATKFVKFAGDVIKIIKSIGTGQFSIAKNIAAGIAEGFKIGTKNRDFKKGFKETISEALGETEGFVGFFAGLEGLVPLFPGFITSLNDSVNALKEDKKKGPETAPGGAGSLRTPGTIAELTRGSVEAFRIRANATLKPTEETAKNTADMNSKLDKMIDVGIPIKNLSVYDLETQLA